MNTGNGRVFGEVGAGEVQVTERYFPPGEVRKESRAKDWSRGMGKLG